MSVNKTLLVALAVGLMGGISACSDVSVPQPRNVDIPKPVSAEKRREAINERPDSVMYLPLGDDVLVPEKMVGGRLPSEHVGPFELRGETLAGALQLILADYDVSIAFESEEGLTRQVTVANLKGPLDRVVTQVCSLADLYCLYEEGSIVVKDTQTFTVSLPPLGDAEGGNEFIGDVITGLSAVIGNSGSAPVSDPTTRTIIYSASQRTSKLAESYFERLRANTAMIVFETYIWEVSLNAGNSAGIDWSELENFGKFNTSVAVNGSISADFTNPISIGLPTTGAVDPSELIQFLSQFGAVKTISQPQITVLSGSSAELRVADTENYVSEVTSTVSGDNTTTSVSTDSVDSGFTLNVGSSWDKSTVYANVNINLTNVDEIEDFAFDTDGGGGQTTIQLPQTTERELTTQIRVRPGDSVLIAGLVRERDNFNTRGPGFMSPILPDSRTAQVDNLELVMLLRPRVIVYSDNDNPQYLAFIEGKKKEMALKNNLVKRTQSFSRNENELVSREQTVVGDVVNGAVSPALLTPANKQELKRPDPESAAMLLQNRRAQVPQVEVEPIRQINKSVNQAQDLAVKSPPVDAPASVPRGLQTYVSVPSGYDNYGDNPYLGLKNTQEYLTKYRAAPLASSSFSPLMADNITSRKKAFLTPRGQIVASNDAKVLDNQAKNVEEKLAAMVEVVPSQVKKQAKAVMRDELVPVYALNQRFTSGGMSMTSRAVQGGELGYNSSVYFLPPLDYR